MQWLNDDIENEGDDGTDGGCDLGDSGNMGMGRGLRGFEYSGSH